MTEFSGSTSLQPSNVPCFHCGEPCDVTPVAFDGKVFCCIGCKTVYEILSQNCATEYYNLETHPGKKAGNYGWGKKYAYLDNDEIRRELMEFSEGGTGRVKFFIPSIHCSACIWLLENLHKIHPGVQHSMVNFGKKEVVITFHEKEVTLRQLVEMLVSLNYIPDISLDSVNKEVKHNVSKGLYYRLGVAGFCFANIMMFSFPAYLSADSAIEAFLIQNFGLLNVLLGIPVAFYSGSPYLVSAWKGLRKKVISIDVPIALGIIVLFVRSTYEIVSGSGHGFMDSLAGLVFFLLIGRWYQGKTYEALSFERDYRSYFPVAVTMLSEKGDELVIPLKNLKTGMRILVRNQELVPADALLVSGAGYIDYSFVTGESTPLIKHPGERIFAGGRQVGSSVELIIEKEVPQSRLTELWNQDASGPVKKDRWDPMIDALGRRFTIVILVISLAAGLFWWWKSPAEAFMVITSVLIIACPCALALTLPFSFGGVMRVFGRNGFYLKRTGVVESLSKVDTIVFDKTGTITQNDVFDVDFSALIMTKEEQGWLRSLVRHSTHPLSVAIYRAIGNEKLIDPVGFEEIPALGLSGTIGGHKIRAGSPGFTGSTQPDTIASGRVFVSVDDKPAGFVQIRNRYRPGMKEVMLELGKKYELHLLSGDNEAELPNLLHYFPSRDHLNFGLSPDDKLRYVKALKEQGRRVLMIGDGLNDAGALRESDCGISIADDVYHFSPACDAILESGKFHRLTAFLRFSKTGINIVYMSLAFSLLYNVVGILFAVSGNLTPVIAAVLMPLSSVTVVSFITLTIMVSAARRGFSVKS
jgi:Cu+-exporting ATPase